MIQEAAKRPKTVSMTNSAAQRLSLFTARHRNDITVVLVIIAVLLLIWLGYLLPWTGFGPRVTAGGQVQSAKTLWDWLQLLSLPGVIAAAAFWFNRSRIQTEFESIRQRDHTARSIAQDDQQEKALHTYLDEMTRLLLNQNLRAAQPGEEVRSLARARTFSTLRLLDSRRSRMLLQFLRETGLIVSRDVISFKEADLSRTNLEEADLKGLDLSGANLKGTNLRGADLLQVNLASANLHSADLSRANLNYADMRRSDLRNADLREAQLFRTNLFTTRLESSNMSGANLSMAQMKLARLNGADLSGANLNEADLSNAILFNANLRGANLTDADLTNASLTNADLTNAILTGAKVTEKQLARARSIAGVTLPDGSIRPPVAATI